MEQLFVARLVPLPVSDHHLDESEASPKARAIQKDNRCKDSERARLSVTCQVSFASGAMAATTQLPGNDEG